MSLILIPKFVYFQRGRNNEHACPGAQVQQFTKVIINEDASKGAKKKKKKKIINYFHPHPHANADIIHDTSYQVE